MTDYTIEKSKSKQKKEMIIQANHFKELTDQSTKQKMILLSLKIKSFLEKSYQKQNLNINLFQLEIDALAADCANKVISNWIAIMKDKCTTDKELGTYLLPSGIASEKLLKGLDTTKVAVIDILCAFLNFQKSLLSESEIALTNTLSLRKLDGHYAVVMY